MVTLYLINTDYRHTLARRVNNDLKTSTGLPFGNFRWTKCFPGTRYPNGELL